MTYLSSLTGGAKSFFAPLSAFAGNPIASSAINAIKTVARFILSPILYTAQRAGFASRLAPVSPGTALAVTAFVTATIGCTWLFASENKLTKAQRETTNTLNALITALKALKLEETLYTVTATSGRIDSELAKQALKFMSLRMRALGILPGDIAEAKDVATVQETLTSAYGLAAVIIAYADTAKGHPLLKELPQLFTVPPLSELIVNARKYEANRVATIKGNVRRFMLGETPLEVPEEL